MAATLADIRDAIALLPKPDQARLLASVAAEVSETMIPGPDRIVACPRCKALGSCMTLTSGNTFGAVVWTDGKRIAPMLPLPPTVVKCHGCAECYWLSDAKEVGTVHRWSAEGKRVDPAWTAAPEVQEPTEDEYYEALRKGLAADTQQEIILRILAWWRRNDEFRDTPQREPASIVTGSEAWRENALALVRLLDEMADHDRLMKAEVLRELGEFESAQEILGRVTSVDYAPVVGQLRSLCEARDAFVRQLEFGS